MTPPSPSPAPRVALIGDIGGHRRELERELVRLGADENTGRLPTDLTVVQVGDLVHRGPDSDGVVALVDRYRREQPSQWVQVIGNHEAQYVRPPAFAWPERIGLDAQAVLRHWWDEGFLHGAVAIAQDAEDRQWLVSHGGVTSGWWDLALNNAPSAADAARAIDSFRGTHDDVLFAAGTSLGGGDADFAAGPVWASAAHELVPSWLDVDEPAPFHQVHGHSSITDWRRGRRRGAAAVAAVTTVDAERSHEESVIRGARIVGIDPQHLKRPRGPWQALVLHNSRIIES